MYWKPLKESCKLYVVVQDRCEKWYRVWISKLQKMYTETACGPCNFLITQLCRWNVKPAFENTWVKKDNYAPIKAHYGDRISHNFRMSKNMIISLPALWVVEAKTHVKSDTSHLEQGWWVVWPKGWRWSRKFESMSKGKTHWTLQEDWEGLTGTSFLPGTLHLYSFNFYNGLQL